MRVALFVPCYIDQFYPQVAAATLEILERFGCDVEYPLNQSCCGQPMANSGFRSMTVGCNANFIKNFGGFDYVVCPSGSCVLHVKEHLGPEDNEQAGHIRKTVYELTEFLVDVLHIDNVGSKFPYKVGLHVSCHGQRGLHLSSMSELVVQRFSKPERLLQKVEGLKIVLPARPDECCGFGGTFCVFEEAVSVKMGKDRIREHDRNSVDFITSIDSSCLMHLEGILKRQGSKVKVIHIVEILNAVNIEK